MAELTLSRTVPSTTEQTWRLMTDPQQMNRWSTARIVGEDRGAEERWDRPGALRKVITPAPARSVLREVVVRAEQPRSFEYRVYAGPSTVRAHRGCISIEKSGDGSRVFWSVYVDFTLPGVAAVVLRSVRAELNRSLDALGEAAWSPPAPAPTSLPVAHPPVALRGLRETAQATLLRQRAIAEELCRVDDPKQWFARVYALVTEEMLVLIDAGALQYPNWALRLIVDFHGHYVQNLAAYRTGPQAERPWADAWSRCEQRDPVRPMAPILGGLIAGVRAHIESDLPRSLCDVYLRDYRKSHHYKDFRADYLSMNGVFARAADRLLAQMPRGYKPLWVRASGLLPVEMRAAVLDRRTYDIPRRRLEAFARGYALACRAGGQGAVTLRSNKRANMI